MTVRELLSVLVDAKELRIGYMSYDTCFAKFDPHDSSMADAYGDYVVSRVFALAEGAFEINIAVRPIKATRTEPEVK